MRTLKVKTGGGGSKFSSGWHTLEVAKAEYGDWNGTKYLDVWFKDYPDSINLRCYAKSGKDGEARTTNTIGNFLSGTTSLDHSSGAGDSSVSQALRLTLNRDGSDNTHTPVIKSLESNYYKQVDTMEGFRFMVDLEATATERGITTEAVITQLETIRDSVVLLPFTYGVRSTIYVRVVDMDFSELFDDTVDTSSSYSQRTGKVLVTIEQVL